MQVVEVISDCKNLEKREQSGGTNFVGRNCFMGRW